MNLLSLISTETYIGILSGTPVPLLCRFPRLLEGQDQRPIWGQFQFSRFSDADIENGGEEGEVLERCYYCTALENFWIEGSNNFH